jgi:hypothetical protein
MDLVSLYDPDPSHFSNQIVTGDESCDKTTKHSVINKRRSTTLEVQGTFFHGLENDDIVLGHAGNHPTGIDS